MYRLATNNLASIFFAKHRMSFLNSLFGGFFGSVKQSQTEIDQARSALDDLDIQVAISAHENWKNRLQAYLDGTSKEVFDANVVCFDDRCDLGKWIHSSGKAKLGQYPGFTALMSHHKMFHFAASNVVALQSRGKTAEADVILRGQFTQFSKSVVGDLNALSGMVLKKQTA
jgi:Chemoreceptor zinc-binding domain